MAQGAEVDLSTVNGATPAADSGVEHAAELLAFTEAAMRADGAGLPVARAALRAVLSPEAYVDTCAILCAFNVVDRIADATTIKSDSRRAERSGLNCHHTETLHVARCFH